MTLIPLLRTVLFTISSQSILPAQTDLPLLVYLQHLDHHFVAFAEDIRHLVDRFTDDMTDILPAGTDHIPYLFGPYFNRRNPGGVRRDIRPGSRKGFAHLF